MIDRGTKSGRMSGLGSETGTNNSDIDKCLPNIGDRYARLIMSQLQEYGYRKTDVELFNRRDLYRDTDK